MMETRGRRECRVTSAHVTDWPNGQWAGYLIGL
jgi:hypothetical protein